MRRQEGFADDDDGRVDWFHWVEVNIGRRVSSNKDPTKAGSECAAGYSGD